MDDRHASNSGQPSAVAAHATMPASMAYADYAIL